MKSRWRIELCKLKGDWSRSRVRTDGLESGNGGLKMREERRPDFLNEALPLSEVIEMAAMIFFPVFLKVQQSGSKKVQV